MPSYHFLTLLICFLQHRVSGEMDLVGIRVDTPRAISRVDRMGLLIVKSNVTMTMRIFGTKLHELKAVYVTTNKRHCDPEHFVQPFINAESFVEISPHTVTFPFRFPWPATRYHFCFQWKEGTSHHHQGVGYYHSIETRTVRRRGSNGQGFVIAD